MQTTVNTLYRSAGIRASLAAFLRSHYIERLVLAASWTAWSDWSDCVDGKRMRVRGCYRSTVQALPCVGDNMEEHPCGNRFPHNQYPGGHRVGPSTHLQCIHFTFCISPINFCDSDLRTVL